jgi:hypothetical protein
MFDSMTGVADVFELLDRLTAAVDRVCAADPTAMADGEAIEALHRQLERLDAATTRATAAFDAGRSWEVAGARSAAAWISARCHLPVETARRRVRLGRRLRHLALVEGAWVAGEIGHAHVEALAAARTPSTTEAFARDEGTLVDLARRLSFRHFAKALCYWRQRADADGVEDDAAAQRADRRLHLSQSIDGLWYLDGCLDPISGAVVANGIKQIEARLFNQDWIEAKTRLGDVVVATDLLRTPAQRRADALVEMVRRAGAVPADARLPAPLFTVLVGYETFAGRVCELADGTAVTPGSLLPWLKEALVERVVFDGPNRVTNVGVRRRLFAGATRRAVQVRDRECFHEFCDLPADDGEVDHIEPYAAGGLTTDSNGRAACRYHNRRRHRRR